jgi:hypothetical protein
MMTSEEFYRFIHSLKPYQMNGSEVRQALDLSLDEMRNLVESVLKDALRDQDASLLVWGWHLWPEEAEPYRRVRPYLIEALSQTWHAQHEDIVLWLDDARDQQNIEVFSAIASSSTTLLLSDAYRRPTVRNAIWALGKLCSEPALDALVRLFSAKPEYAAVYAKHQVLRLAQGPPQCRPELAMRARELCLKFRSTISVVGWVNSSEGIVDGELTYQDDLDRLKGVLLQHTQEARAAEVIEALWPRMRARGQWSVAEAETMGEVLQTLLPVLRALPPENIQEPWKRELIELDGFEPENLEECYFSTHNGTVLEGLISLCESSRRENNPIQWF